MLYIHEMKFSNHPKTIYVYNIIEPSKLKPLILTCDLRKLRFTALNGKETFFQKYSLYSMTTKQDFGRTSPLTLPPVIQWR